MQPNKKLSSGTSPLFPEAGFTLIELLITIAIIAFLAGVSFIMLNNVKPKNDVNDTAMQIVAVLRQAQAQSMDDEQGTTWGVHFGNGTGASSSSFYALFSGSSYLSGTVTGYYKLPVTVAYQTSTLAANASTDIVFADIIGASSVSTSIGIYESAASSQSSTISIASSGEVSY